MLVQFSVAPQYTLGWMHISSSVDEDVFLFVCFNAFPADISVIHAVQYVSLSANTGRRGEGLLATEGGRGACVFLCVFVGMGGGN